MSALHILDQILSRTYSFFDDEIVDPCRKFKRSLMIKIGLRLETVPPLVDFSKAGLKRHLDFLEKTDPETRCSGPHIDVRGVKSFEYTCPTCGFDTIYLSPEIPYRNPEKTIKVDNLEIAPLVRNIELARAIFLEFTELKIHLEEKGICRRCFPNEWPRQPRYILSVGYSKD